MQIFSLLQYMMPNFEVGARKHTRKSRMSTKIKGEIPTSRAYSDADPGLVCPIAAAAAAATSAVAAAGDILFLKNNQPKRHGYITDRYDRVRTCSFMSVQHNIEPLT